MTSRFKRKSVECFHCGKPGHLKHNCRLLSAEKQKFRPNRHGKQKANIASIVNECSSDSGSDALMVSYTVLSASTTTKLIIDSGASCHMCCDSGLFDKLKVLTHPIDVSVGDGRSLKGRGIISLNMKLSDEKLNKCRLLDVLYVPKLSYNLLSVPKVTDLDKTTDFDEKGCKIYTAKGKLIAEGSKIGSLYYFNYLQCNMKVNVANRKTKENICHCRFGHLGTQNLQRLV